jgi:hypothetical protein
MWAAYVGCVGSYVLCIHCIEGERRKWKEEQKEATITLMDKLTNEHKPPRKKDILDLQFKYPCLNSKAMERDQVYGVVYGAKIAEEATANGDKTNDK